MLLLTSPVSDYVYDENNNIFSKIEGHFKHQLDAEIYRTILYHIVLPHNTVSAFPLFIRLSHNISQCIQCS